MKLRLSPYRRRERRIYGSPTGIAHEKERESFCYYCKHDMDLKKQLENILNSIGFTQSPFKLCLLINKSSLGIGMMVIHVDDSFSIGS